MELFVLVVTVLQFAIAYPTEYNSEMSFKRLESGENSGETVNQCCQRESKYVAVGHGITEGEVRIDVGQCRQKCVMPSLKPLRREEFDKYLKKYPDMDPIQIFLSLQNKSPVDGDSPSTSSGENKNEQDNNSHHNHRYSSGNGHRVSASCLQSICLPSSIKRESYYDLSGEVKEVDVIESCDCVTLPHGRCQRLPSPVKVHVDTPYEKEVDLGQCIGSCDDASSSENCFSCKAVRNRTISMEGPNGAHCLSVIDECQCAGECFRLRQFLKVYDYTHAFETTAPLMNSIGDKGNNESSINNPIGYVRNGSEQSSELIGVMNDSSLEPLTKVIDIGRCSGSCSDVPVASKCLLWSSPNNGTCLSYLSGGKSKCTATKFVSHSYTDKQGKKHTVMSVTGCGCR